MQAIGYIRVSTVDQADSGLSLEAQRQKIRSWSDANDYELVDIYTDIERQLQGWKSLLSSDSDAIDLFIEEEAAFLGTDLKKMGVTSTDVLSTNRLYVICKKIIIYRVGVQWLESTSHEAPEGSLSQRWEKRADRLWQRVVDSFEAAHESWDAEKHLGSFQVGKTTDSSVPKNFWNSLDGF